MHRGGRKLVRKEAVVVCSWKQQGGVTLQAVFTRHMGCTRGHRQQDAGRPRRSAPAAVLHLAIEVLHEIEETRCTRGKTEGRTGLCGLLVVEAHQQGCVAEADARASRLNGGGDLLDDVLGCEQQARCGAHGRCAGTVAGTRKA